MTTKFKFLYALNVVTISAFSSFIIIYVMTRSIEVGIMSIPYTAVVVMVGLEELFFGSESRRHKLAHGGLRRIRFSMLLCGLITGLLAACTLYVFFKFKASYAIAPAIMSAVIPGTFLRMQIKGADE